MATFHDLSLVPHQRERLAGNLRAMNFNVVELRKPRTRLFPWNISAAVFVRLFEDPVLNLPHMLGCRALDEAGNEIDSATWTVGNEEELLPIWESFSRWFLVVWKNTIGGGKGPHLFHFGEKTWRGLRRWGESAGKANLLAFLWRSGRIHRTNLQRLVREHFYLPAPGKLTVLALDRILGLSSPGIEEAGDFAAGWPESFFHDDPQPGLPRVEGMEERASGEDCISHVRRLLEIEGKIWRWAHRHLESDFEQTEWGEGPGEQESMAAAYLDFLEEERRLREEDIRSLQEFSLEERIEQFRALGPIRFQGTSLDEEGRFLLDFQLSGENRLSKFREEDFLKLVPLGSKDLQSGFPVILARYDQDRGRFSLLPREERPALSTHLAYSFEEDLTDWNHPKLVHGVEATLGSGKEHPVSGLLSGEWTRDQESSMASWVREWFRTFEPISGINPVQKKALELPFLKRLSLIEGPPGTGKTHLLAWIIIALVLHAQHRERPLRLAVSALTHQAIDGVLFKVAELVNLHRIKDFSARLSKWGRWREDASTWAEAGEEATGWSPVQVGSLHGSEEIAGCRHLVLGSTTFGLYRLFDSRTGAFPPVFDWIVFDEASQILVPQAILGLAYGKGCAVFLGDTRQLPPIVLGKSSKRGREDGIELSSDSDEGGRGIGASPRQVSRSILSHLLDCYGERHRVRLEVTYRMNEELCAFPSRMWYDGSLRPAEGNARSRLRLKPANPDQPQAPHQNVPGDHTAASLLAEAGFDPDPILDPRQPVTLVLADHRGCGQKSDLEVEIVARLAHHLMMEHGLSSDRLAVVSPHRAQNNAIVRKMKQLLGGGDVALPVIDTVERLQGAEREVILLSMTASDPDRVMDEFLNHPNRFNVAITRARHKLVVVGSRTFFLGVPRSVEALEANRCFKEFLRFCLSRRSVVLL